MHKGLSKKGLIYIGMFIFFTIYNIAWIVLPPKNIHVVVMNNEDLMQQFVRQLSMHTLSDNELKEKTERFTLTLKQVLSDYANTHHVLILDQKNVLSGGENVTLVIADRVAKQMRGGA